MNNTDLRIGDKIRYERNGTACEGYITNVGTEAYLVTQTYHYNCAIDFEGSVNIVRYNEVVMLLN